MEYSECVPGRSNTSWCATQVDDDGVSYREYGECISLLYFTTILYFCTILIYCATVTMAKIVYSGYCNVIQYGYFTTCN